MKTSNNTTELSESNVLRMYCRVLPAQFFLYALSCLRCTINGAIVGTAMDTVSLAAVALYAPFTCILAAVYGMVSSGCTILCGHKLGRGDIKGMHGVFATSVWVAFAVALIIGALMMIFPESLAILLGSGDAVLPQTAAYIRGQAIGLIPALLVPVLASYIQINNRSSQIFIYAIIQGIANLGFVLAAVRIPGSDLFTVSVASSLSSYLPLLYLAVYISREHLASGILRCFDLSMVGHLLVLGIPASALSLFTGVRDVLINNQVMLFGGTDAMAAMAVLSATWLIIDGVVYGSGNSVKVLSGVFYGEGDGKSQIKLFEISSVIGLILTAVIGIIYILLSDSLSVLFGGNLQIKELTHNLILIYCIGRFFVLILVILIGIYQCNGHTVTAFLCNIAAFFVFPLLACFLLKDGFGITGIWVSSYLIGPALMLLLVPVVIGRFSFSPARILLLKENDDSPSFSVSLHSIDEAVNISEQIQRFCEDNNIESRRRFLCALCLEEMSLIIFNQGYGQNPGVVDILVRVEDGSIRMRLRDNAPKFDVTERFAACQEIKEDPAANIGIRIVMKSAESASYSSVFGTNTLLLKL